MDRAWREHLDALKRFNAWEARRLAERPGNFAAALAWLSEAWEVADRYGPGHDPAADREAHLRELMRLRSALERAGLSP